jgi:hypothetical protein
MDKLYSNAIKLSQILEIEYKQFWKNIYYNDAYIFYKEAILFYKNNEHENFHSFYSGSINKFLYLGSCQYIDNIQKNTFSNISKTSSDDLCRLAKNIINILDEVFEIAPKLSNPIVTYRFQTHDKNDEIANLIKGDIFHNTGYFCTSIVPFGFEYSNIYLNMIQIKFILLLPQNTKCYYINNPFFYDWHKILNNKIYAHNEYEIVLPRGCYWKIIDKKLCGKNKIIYIMELLNQPKNEKVEQNFFKPKKIKWSEKEYLTKFSNIKLNLYDKFKDIIINSIFISFMFKKHNKNFIKNNKKTIIPKNEYIIIQITPYELELYKSMQKQLNNEKIYIKHKFNFMIYNDDIFSNINLYSSLGGHFYSCPDKESPKTNENLFEIIPELPSYFRIKIKLKNSLNVEQIDDNLFLYDSKTPFEINVIDKQKINYGLYDNSYFGYELSS